MSDTREEFEKALNDCILETQCMLNYDEAATRDIALFIWQAQQAKIDTLTEKLAFQDRWLSNGVYFTNEEYGKEVCKIRALEARCKELTEALEVVNDQLIEGKVFTQQMHQRPYWRYSVTDALSTQSPQEALDRFENDCYEKAIACVTNGSYMHSIAKINALKKEVK